MNLFTEKLMAWYADNGRDLPWRATRDPYLIWVSEIILQQTRVGQGCDYYLRFTRRFPDVAALASASQDEVLKYWQGLGYYSRARNLHEAAKGMNGEFPTSYEGVRALKGVGDYTAAAVCAFAYDMPFAVVDGNVYRVLARYFGIDTPIDSAEGKRLFATLAGELMDKRRPADYNQAIMDFGAVQCTAATPRCLLCPLAESCSARASGLVEKLPVKGHKTKTVNRYFNYLLVLVGECVCMGKRTGNDIWKNLFELPLVETERALTQEEFLASPALQALLPVDCRPQVRLVRGNVKHVLTHRVIYANFYEVTLPRDTRAFSGYLHIPIAELERYAVPRLIHAFLHGEGLV